jgi:hypothetical protein
LDKIAGVRTDRNDRPLTPVVIEKVVVEDEPERDFPTIAEEF